MHEEQLRARIEAESKILNHYPRKKKGDFLAMDSSEEIIERQLWVLKRMLQGKIAALEGLKYLDQFEKSRIEIVDLDRNRSSTMSIQELEWLIDAKIAIRNHQQEKNRENCFIESYFQHKM